MRPLSDTWHGRFSYPDDAHGPQTEFVATLLQAGDLLSGATHEIGTTGASAGLILCAAIEGRRDGAGVAFTKTYEASAHALGLRQVRYEGVLSADENEIDGTWKIGEYGPGVFLMIRANRPAFAAQLRIAAPTRQLAPAGLPTADRPAKDGS